MSSQMQYNVFIESWHNLLEFFDKIAQLPEDIASFNDLYGNFDNDKGVIEFVNSCTIINSQAKNIGSPVSLKKQLAENAYLFQDNIPPGDLYCHIIWFSNLIQNSSSSIKEILNNLSNLFINESASKEEQADKLKLVLLGDNGITAQADQIKDEISRLYDKISFIQKNFFNAVTTISQTLLLNEANQSIGALQNLISTQQKKVSDAHKKCMHSIINKEKARKDYESLKAELDSMLMEIKKKQSFANIMDNDFFISDNQVSTAIQNIKANIKSIGKIFSDFSEDMKNICVVSTTKQLSDYKWVSSALNLNKSVLNWDGIRNESKEFIEKAMIN